MKQLGNQPLDGPHEEFFAGGKLSAEGRLRNGKRHGKWKYYYRNGRLKAVGKYVDGEFDGNWEWWRENGRSLQTGALKNGKQVGLWKRYYDNGQLWDEGTYDNGKKVGEWKVYDKAGALKQRKVFRAKRYRCAGGSLEANTLFQLDVVAGLRGQVKKDRKMRKRFARCRFGAQPNDYRM